MNSIPRPNILVEDAALKRALDLRDEARHLTALARDNAAKIERIQAFHSAGMSRRRLIQTYGMELVDLALTA